MPIAKKVWWHFRTIKNLTFRKPFIESVNTCIENSKIKIHPK